MEFDENHIVKIETLSEAEARAYIAFLWSEKYRHEEDVVSILKKIDQVKRRFGWA